MAKPVRVLGTAYDQYFDYNCVETGRKEEPVGIPPEHVRSELPYFTVHPAHTICEVVTFETTEGPPHVIKVVSREYSKVAPGYFLNLYLDEEFAAFARLQESDEEVCVVVFEY